MRSRLLSLQILRFAAAAMVVVMHAGHTARLAAGLGDAPFYPTDIGAAGVDVFFVLSGFVIALTGPLAHPRPAGAEFFWRRWSRVAPLYYLLSLPIAVAARTGTPGWWSKAGATILFWPAWRGWIVQPFIAAGWTLCFEMVFYSAVSLALAGGRLRRNLVILVAVAAGLIAARRMSDAAALRILANGIFLEFAAGVALAGLWPRLRRAPPAVGLALIAAGIAALAFQAVFGAGDAIAWQATMLDTGALRRALAFGGPAVALVGGALILERRVAGAAARAAGWLGDASYSTYLAQGLAIPILGRAWISTAGPRHPWGEAIFLILAIHALGAACHVALERPLTALVRRRPLAGPRRAGAA